MAVSSPALSFDAASQVWRARAWVTNTGKRAGAEVVQVYLSLPPGAGALGTPVWVLLPFVPDWRWLLGRGDSPWYPSARLFRQPARRDWDSVVRDIRGALDALPSR